MRLTFRSLMAIGMFCTALLLPGAAAAAQPDRPVPVESLQHEPIGVWSGQVTSSSVGEIEVTMALLDNGQVCLIVPPPGPEGGVEGTGHWYRTARGTFSLHVVERFFDGEGATTAYLRAGYRVTMDDDEFTAFGKGGFYSSDGRLEERFTAVMEMSREDTEATC